ncbi:MAG: hypothetical protein EZS28_053300, partial [Streblomastix strix]
MQQDNNNNNDDDEFIDEDEDDDHNNFVESDIKGFSSGLSSFQSGKTNTDSISLKSPDSSYINKSNNLKRSGDISIDDLSKEGFDDDQDNTNDDLIGGYMPTSASSNVNASGSAGKDVKRKVRSQVGAIGSSSNSGSTGSISSGGQQQ